MVTNESIKPTASAKMSPLVLFLPQVCPLGIPQILVLLYPRLTTQIDTTDYSFVFYFEYISFEIELSRNFEFYHGMHFVRKGELE